MSKARSLWLAGAAVLCFTVPSCGIEPTISTTATKIAFLDQPGSVQADAPLGTVTVAFLTAQEVIAANATDSVQLSLVTIDPDAHLLGTLKVGAITGVATFSDLSVDKAGNGYRLLAKATGFTDALSNTFNITP